LTHLSKKIQGEKAPNPKHPGNSDTVKRSNLRIIRIEQVKDSQLKRPENTFKKIIEENFYNLK